MPYLLLIQIHLCLFNYLLYFFILFFPAGLFISMFFLHFLSLILTFPHAFLSYYANEKWLCDLRLHQLLNHKFCINSSGLKGCGRTLIVLYFVVFIFHYFLVFYCIYHGALFTHVCCKTMLHDVQYSDSCLIYLVGSAGGGRAPHILPRAPKCLGPALLVIFALQWPLEASTVKKNRQKPPKNYDSCIPR